MAPATPAGIQELLLRTGVETTGAEVVVVGRSNIVGKPVAAMLMQKRPGGNATVTVCHTATKDRRAYPAGRHPHRRHRPPQTITAPMVAPGEVVIDVGMNRTEAGLSGDVDFNAVKEIVSAINPGSGRRRPDDDSDAAEERSSPSVLAS